MTRLLGLACVLAGFAGLAVAGITQPVPEVDATTGVAALGLLGGAILVLRSRKKK